MMNFEGNMGVEEKPLFTGLALCKPTSIKLSDNGESLWIPFKFQDGDFLVGVTVKDEVVVSSTGSHLYMSTKGDWRSFYIKDEDTMFEIKNSNGREWSFFTKENEPVKARIGEIDWYEFLRQLLSYQSNQETFLKDMKANKLDFDSVLKGKSDFASLIDHVNTSNCQIVLPLVVREKADGTLSQSSLFRYIYRSEVNNGNLIVPQKATTAFQRQVENAEKAGNKITNSFFSIKYQEFTPLQSTETTDTPDW
jgi:hypothetical protein